jgi:hypothetical protein
MHLRWRIDAPRMQVNNRELTGFGNAGQHPLFAALLAYQHTSNGIAAAAHQELYRYV